MEKRKKIYCFSGLGADKRIFAALERISSFQLIFIEWAKPKSKSTSLKEYAESLKNQINEENPILLGVSFGAMIALEMHQLFPDSTLISISSITNNKQWPWFIRLLRRFPFKNALPFTIVKNVNFFTYWVFGVKSTERKLLKTIIKETNSRFISWAFYQVLNWNPPTKQFNGIQIHGTSDYVLPLRDTTHVLILKGGHLIVWYKAKRIEEEIKLITSNH